MSEETKKRGRPAKETVQKAVSKREFAEDKCQGCGGFVLDPLYDYCESCIEDSELVKKFEDSIKLSKEAIEEANKRIEEYEQQIEIARQSMRSRSVRPSQ